MEPLASRFTKDVLNRYLELIQARYLIHPDFADAEDQWKSQLTAEKLVNGPFLESAHSYKAGAGLADLPIDERTRATISAKLSGRTLWSHQSRAIRGILDGRSTVVATGTSSGKTLCYQIPILDDLIRDPAPGLRAIIIYPLNALVNDQLAEWEEILKEHTGIRFARFTGQTPNSEADYEAALRQAIKHELSSRGDSQQEIEREVNRRVDHEISKFPNRLNHRDAIRKKPPQILITNFSMLEYLLERPIDAPIFEQARLKFIVLDEAHAYRGVQATEIAFLMRRLKDRLQPEKLVCIATSATLGNRDDPESQRRVGKFAGDLFGEDVEKPSLIFSEDLDPKLEEPAASPTPRQYALAAEIIRKTGDYRDAAKTLGMPATNAAVGFGHDGNLFKLRSQILKKPTLLQDAAKQLWPGEDEQSAANGLSAMLEIIASTPSASDLLPTRLHYFVKALDGFHICLRDTCPGRNGGRAAFFVSRQPADTAAGFCPHCCSVGIHSTLVEVVACRRCGYLFGALQDLGPRYAQDPDHQSPPEPKFDSFSTELGWSAESFWSYFSVDGDLPFPETAADDAEDSDGVTDLLSHPFSVDWCVACGKRIGGEGEVCVCKQPSRRVLKIFHRQCPVGSRAKDVERLFKAEKKLLKACPNCGVPRGSGPEPLQRFQESEDAMGTAMAIPLSHFETSPKDGVRAQPKLLCFTDNRQRAAALPSILEDETFTHEFSRRAWGAIRGGASTSFVHLGERLADESENDPRFFLPVSREIDEGAMANRRARQNLWISEVFGYFTLPDPRRASIADIGLVEVEYQLNATEKQLASELFSKFDLTVEDSCAAMQTLLAVMRRRKAISLPKGVDPDAAAFGQVDWKVAYTLNQSGRDKWRSWIPAPNRKNAITDYLERLTKTSDRIALTGIAEGAWNIAEERLIQENGGFVLDHELFLIRPAKNRYICSRCGTTTAVSARGCCPNMGCRGSLEPKAFDKNTASIIDRWIADAESPMFVELRAEEHTSQVKKDLAKIVEDRFRADEGINLISSTTTFEMGINIGSLQKVLLRNAPPSSASYVQRVGRAGRGADRNAICVTMCRRSKYDSDMWRDPQRLMAGALRPPTVFLENKVISQRHFNAVAFAAFLREKLLTAKMLDEPQQTVRVEAFLKPECRNRVPEGYRKCDPPEDKFLDFIGWLEVTNPRTVFGTDQCWSFFNDHLGLGDAVKHAVDQYKKAIESVEADISTLLGGRKEASDLGNDRDANELGQGVKNLLAADAMNFLAENGFLPRYAFPLDVVSLETGETRWSSSSEVDLSRSRGIAICEFAPGAQVVARKTVYESAGLYVLSKTDEPEKRWYSKCPGCKQIRTGRLQEDVCNKQCEVCQNSIHRQHAKIFVIPDAFSVKLERQSSRRPQRFRADKLVRRRQGITHFIEQVDDSHFTDADGFSLAVKDNGRLFRYNLGPRSQGFRLCPKCGFSQPNTNNQKNGQRGPHKRLRVLGGYPECSYSLWPEVAFGSEIESFCLVIRPKGHPSSPKSLAFALRNGMCRLLEVDASEIGVVLRQRHNSLPEIILYDQTPGGAGFVREGKERFREVLERAESLCKCSCERACYDCLKDYGNQSFHNSLDRKSVLEFLASLPRPNDDDVIRLGAENAADPS